MRCYLEITLLPNPEVNIHFLWSKVYQQLHLGLVETQDAQKRVPIGISFPEYVVGEKYSVLGGKCRLFAQDEATLIRFDVNKWLARLSDYVHCTSIRPVPDKVSGYAIYQRQQPKTNPARLARRYAKRHDMDFETALHDTINLAGKATPNTTYQQTFRYCDMPSKAISTPFIRLKSLSSGQDFCLWLKKSTASEPVVADFSSYGLSASATVPEF
jgi:CRISPR-associated endonuclease Csy4